MTKLMAIASVVVQSPDMHAFNFAAHSRQDRQQNVPCVFACFRSLRDPIYAQSTSVKDTAHHRGRTLGLEEHARLNAACRVPPTWYADVTEGWSP